MGNGASPRYTFAEDQFIVDSFKKGLGATEIYRLNILSSNRTVPSIQSRMERLALVKTKRFTCEDEPDDLMDDAAFVDRKFCEAMHKAIRLGLERAPIGVVKDETPLIPKRIASPPLWSGCGSSAGMCADIGSRSSFI